MVIRSSVLGWSEHAQQAFDDFFYDCFGGDYSGRVRRPSIDTFTQIGNPLIVPLRNLLKRQLSSQPILSKSQYRFLNLLQRHTPVLNLGPLTVVTGYSAVSEVLRQDNVFSVEKVYGPRTDRDNGPFVLSMDQQEVHAREKALLNAVMPAEDFAELTDKADEWVELALRPYLTVGRIDVVQAFTRQVPYLLIKEYFGVPGPNDRLLKQWMSDIFEDIFTNAFNRSEIAERGEASGKALGEYLIGHIEYLESRLERGDPLPDTVLLRMIKLKSSQEWLNNDTIRRNISGLIVGALETTSKAATLALEALFQRPFTYANVKALANSMKQKGGVKSAKGTKRSRSTDIGHLNLIRGYVYEMLRFNPHNPFLMRHCREDYTFESAGVSGKATTVKAGSWCIVSTNAAQHDPAQVADPHEVDPEREIDYMLFGAGLHKCQGAQLNAIMLPKMIRALVELEGLRPLSGNSGKLCYTGPFPSKWCCQFDAVE